MRGILNIYLNTQQWVVGEGFCDHAHVCAKNSNLMIIKHLRTTALSNCHLWAAGSGSKAWWHAVACYGTQSFKHIKLSRVNADSGGNSGIIRDMECWMENLWTLSTIPLEAAYYNQFSSAGSSCTPYPMERRLRDLPCTEIFILRILASQFSADEPFWNHAQPSCHH